MEYQNEIFLLDILFSYLKFEHLSFQIVISISI